METDLPRLETLMLKHSDDDEMYRARCRAINELIYQLEDENNLVALKVAQTKRRIASKKVALKDMIARREREELEAEAERSSALDEPKQVTAHASAGDAPVPPRLSTDPADPAYPSSTLTPPEPQVQPADDSGRSQTLIGFANADIPVC